MELTIVGILILFDFMTPCICLYLVHGCNCPIVRVFASTAESQGFHPQQGQTKDEKLAFTASLLSMHHLVVRAKTGHPRVRIMCLGKVACLTSDCFLSMLPYKSSSVVGLV